MEEYKLGQVFSLKNKWWQCLETKELCSCDGCEFDEFCEEVDMFCSRLHRSDGKNVIFKQLREIGKPLQFGKKHMQRYKIFAKPYIPKDIGCFVIKSEPIGKRKQNSILIEKQIGEYGTGN